MGQKANPLSLRLQNFRRTFDSCWYSDYFYSKCQSRDLNLKNYVNTFYKLIKLPQARIGIDFGLESVKIWAFFCQPKTFRVDLAKNLNITQHLSKAWKIDATKSTYNNSRLRTPLLNSKEAYAPYHISKKNPLALYLSTMEWKKWWQGLIYKAALIENQNRIFNQASLNRKLLLVISERNKRSNQPARSFFTNMKYNQDNNKSNSINRNLITRNDITNGLPDTQLNDNISFSLTKGKRQQILHELLTLYYYQKKLIINKNHENFVKIDLEHTNNFLLNRLQKSQLIISNKDFKYRNHIENYLSSQMALDAQYFPFVGRQCWQSANFLADEIVYFLERRVSFSRLRNRISRQASMQPFIRGIRITCSGRVGGKSKKAQRATQECIKYGSTGGHVFENRIDFASTSAHTPFGLLGIKVWICFK